ncbi:Thioredoxin family protein [Quillaja saponaria]|uniref:Thioredoxin family protein n=1 Tax=Quillaja saponaria TaxID=32244 RepID=A0AAD7VDI2_QUISA|nr:Thioredoxin family protein [Quillaja saponaria]
MAGALNLTQYPLIAPISFSRNFSTRSRLVSIRASSNFADNPSSSTSTTSSVSTKEEPTPGSVSSSSFTAPIDFKPPEPKRFAIRPDQTNNILGALLPLVFRFATGVFASGYSVSFVSKDEIPPDQYALEIAGYKVKETAKLGPRPEKPIEIYEFESCPFCRKVREIVAVLDLDVLFYPCPRNSPNFRPKVAEMGGKQQFPYMVDPNTGVSMYESDDIIKYLVENYGDGTVPFTLSLGLLTTLTAGFAMLGRRGKGTTYIPSRLPPEPLKIWAYEGSPFCKIVREALVELELPHILYSCARGSPKRQILFEKTGHFQAPYLEDPNTGVQMFESGEIVEYLRAIYALQ